MSDQRSDKRVRFLDNDTDIIVQDLLPYTEDDVEENTRHIRDLGLKLHNDRYVRQNTAYLHTKYEQLKKQNTKMIQEHQQIHAILKDDKEMNNALKDEPITQREGFVFRGKEPIERGGNKYSYGESVKTIRNDSDGIELEQNFGYHNSEGKLHAYGKKKYIKVSRDGERKLQREVIGEFHNGELNPLNIVQEKDYENDRHLLHVTTPDFQTFLLQKTPIDDNDTQLMHFKHYKTDGTSTQIEKADDEDHFSIQKLKNDILDGPRMEYKLDENDNLHPTMLQNYKDGNLEFSTEGEYTQEDLETLHEKFSQKLKAQGTTDEDIQQQIINNATTSSSSSSTVPEVSNDLQEVSNDLDDIPHLEI